MKLALIQCNVKSGDLTENSRIILDRIHNAGPVDLCIMPSGALTGPHKPGACNPSWPFALRAILDKIASDTAAGPALLGHAESIGYFLIKDGAWSETPHIFNFQNTRIGVDLKPADAPKIDLGIALRPRPFSINGSDEWELLLSGFCRQGCIWGFSVNLCGGYENYIYAGGSFAIAPDGVLAARAKMFAEDCLIVDTDAISGSGRIEAIPSSQTETAWLALTLGLHDFIAKQGNPDVFLGLSGGIDSALAACIAKEALGPKKVTGVLMPSPYTSQESIEDARNLAKNLAINSLEIPITLLLEDFIRTLEPAAAKLREMRGQVMQENIQARLRGNILMALANYSGGLVLNCGNKSEAAMGYCTLYGDTVGAVGVIGDLLKTQVYALARWYCKMKGQEVIPENIFQKAPSAELKPNQKDTDTLPPYDELDPSLQKLLTYNSMLNNERDPAVEKMAAKVAACAFKRRQSPPPFLVSGEPLD